MAFGNHEKLWTILEMYAKKLSKILKVDFIYGYSIFDDYFHLAWGQLKLLWLSLRVWNFVHRDHPVNGNTWSELFLFNFNKVAR